MSPKSTTMPFKALSPLSVVIPVFGQQAVLESHIRHHQKLYQSCGETIWVVTPTQDGAHKVARDAALRFKGKYYERKPGLYEAWNTGIEYAEKKWIYFNTIGDYCNFQELVVLFNKSIKYRPDIAFSPPNNSKQERRLKKWPIFLYASELNKWESSIVPSEIILKLQILSGESNLLGSLAGSLFFTEYLKQHIFKTDFKSFGDTAWTYENCLKAKFFYTKTPIAGFSFHESSRQKIHPRDLEKLLITLSFKFTRQQILKKRVIRFLACRRLCNSLRGLKPKAFWYLYPKALIAWHKRVTAFREMLRCFIKEARR